MTEGKEGYDNPAMIMDNGTTMQNGTTNGVVRNGSIGNGTTNGCIGNGTTNGSVGNGTANGNVGNGATNGSIGNGTTNGSVGLDSFSNGRKFSQPSLYTTDTNTDIYKIGQNGRRQSYFVEPKEEKYSCSKLIELLMAKKQPKRTYCGCITIPASGKFGTVLTWFIYTLLFWGALYAVTGDTALPKGNLFSLLVMLIAAQLGGMFVEKLTLPPLLGMLIVGVLLRSVPYISIIGDNIDSQWSAVIRKMALVVILTRAGLGLDPKALRQLSMMVIRMGIIPNVVEMCVVAVVAHFLIGFPWLWCFLLGFIFSAVSPSVVVPCMLMLSDRKLGTNKGVPTLVIAGLSIDNALSISGIGVFLGIIFSEGSVVWQAFKGPVEVIVGIAFGIIMGILCWSIPNRFEKGYAKFRFFFLFTVGLLSVFGSQKLNFGGAGAMGCLTTSFVAGIGWRNQGWKDNDHPVKKNFNFLWSFLQPLLFSLIGREIQLSALSGATVGWGALTLLIGLTFRFAVCFAINHGGELNFREKLFTAVAWIPKATIQAAFGSTAYDFARSQNLNPEGGETQEEIYGKQVLTLAVLAIVLAAPIGAILIMLTAPRLLKQEQEKEREANEA